MRLSRFSTTTKYQTSKAIGIAALIVAGYFLCCMSPWETQQHNRHNFAVVMITVVIGIGSSLAMYYYRAKQKNQFSDIDVQTLGGVGAVMRSKPTQSAITTQAKRQK